MPACTSPRRACSPSRSVRRSSPTISPTRRRRLISPIRPQQQSFDSLLLQNTATGQTIGSLADGRDDQQGRDRHLAGAAARDRTAAGLRDRRRRYTSRSNRPGRPLHARRAVQLQRRRQLVDSSRHQVCPRAAVRSRSAPRELLPAPRSGCSTSAAPPRWATTLHRNGLGSAPPASCTGGRAGGLRRRPDPDDDRHDRLAARLSGGPERDPVDRSDDAGKRVQHRFPGG